MKYVLASLIKTGLYTFQQLRLITDTLWTMYHVKPDHYIIKAAVTEGKKYREATAGRADHGQCFHIHVSSSP